MSGTAEATLLIDNERTRVTRWRFRPGEATGWHRHEYDYVVIPSLDGRLRLVEADGVQAHADLKQGSPYFRPAGVEHDVINANEYDFEFIEVELK